MRGSRARHLFAVAVLVGVAAVAGCSSGDKTCSDACGNYVGCLDRLAADGGSGPSMTITECSAACTAFCSDKQQAIDCVAGMRCVSEDQLASDLASCGAGCL